MRAGLKAFSVRVPIALAVRLDAARNALPRIGETGVPSISDVVTVALGAWVEGVERKIGKGKK